MARSIRVSDECYEAAQRVAASLSRSLAQQVEHWIRLGMRVDSGLTAAQTIALLESGASTVDARVRTEMRHAQFEAEVAAGQRNADSLIAIPARLARKSRLTFPPATAFGKERDW